MSRAPQRGRRGEVRLVMRDGAWTIYWGRALARELGCARRESTGTTDRPEAERILRVRLVEVAQRRGDQAGMDALRRTAPAVPLDVLVSDFLRALAAGDLPGAKPRPSTLEGYMAHLLGARGGLVAFARAVDRATSDRLDRVLVERWLEAERGRAAPDTLRLKLIAARRLAAFAESRALMPPERLTAIRALRPPASARGRARVDGVPSEDEIRGLLAALSPARWRPVAELQLRLGLRRAEVLAIREEWIDEPSGCVLVRVGDGFDTKSHSSRIVDGVDAETFALAREVLAMKARKPFSVSGYTMAWKRACKRLARAGTPWKYRSKTHGLRSAYATASRLAGVPLSVVRDRMGTRASGRRSGTTSGGSPRRRSPDRSRACPASRPPRAPELPRCRSPVAPRTTTTPPRRGLPKAEALVERNARQPPERSARGPPAYGGQENRRSAPRVRREGARPRRVTSEKREAPAPTGASLRSIWRRSTMGGLGRERSVPTTTCACGRPATKPRAHATRAPDRCVRCRGLARRSAYKGRQRVGLRLVRPMLDAFGRGNPFDLKAALPIAAPFGFGRRALRAWLLELVEEDGTVTRSGSGTSALYAFDVSPGPEASPRTDPKVTAVSNADEPPIHADPPAEAAPISAGTGRALDTLPEGKDPRAQRGRGAVGAAEGRDVKRGGRPKRPWAGCSGNLVDRLLPILLDHRERVTAVRNLVDELDLDPELGADAVPVSVPLVLYAVSITEPEHRRAAYDADAKLFAARMMAEGSAGVLLVKDVREPARLPRGLPPGLWDVLRVATGGAPHGYGLVLREAGAEEAISRAWIQTAHAHSGCQKVTPVTGWKAFAESGDPDAREGKRGTFTQNLARVVDYTLKPWPAEYGERDLARDALARGVFEDLWAGALAAVFAGALRL